MARIKANKPRRRSSEGEKKEEKEKEESEEKEEKEESEEREENEERESTPDDVYEVESLEAFRFSTQPPYHLLEILIKWRGYSPDENTWEPRKSLDAPMDSYSWSKQAKKDYEENLECKHTNGQSRSPMLRKSYGLVGKRRAKRPVIARRTSCSSIQPQGNSTSNKFTAEFKKAWTGSTDCPLPFPHITQDVQMGGTSVSAGHRRAAQEFMSPKDRQGYQDGARPTEPMTVSKKQPFPKFPDFPIFPSSPELIHVTKDIFKDDCKGKKRSRPDTDDLTVREEKKKASRPEPCKHDEFYMKSAPNASTTTQSQVDATATQRTSLSVLEGDQAYNRKEYDLACAKYTEVLRKVQKMNTDEAANLVCRKAAVYMQQGNYDAVTRIFSYTFWETYDSHRWMRMQAMWFRCQDDADLLAVVQDARRLIEPLYKSVEVLQPFNLVPNTERLQSIKDGLRNALNLKKKARLLHYDGKYKDAISTYQEAIYYEEQGQGCAPIPFLATLYGGLGAVYAICGDVFNAVLSYSRAQALQPSVLSYTKQLFLLFKDAGLRRPTMEVRDHFMLVPGAKDADKQEMLQLKAPLQALEVQTISRAYKVMNMNPRAASPQECKERYRTIMRLTHPDIVPRYIEKLAHSLCKEHVGSENGTVQGKSQLTVSLSARFDWCNKVLLEHLRKVQNDTESSHQGSVQNRARQKK